MPTTRWSNAPASGGSLVAQPHGGGDLELRLSDDNAFGMSVSTGCTDLLKYVCEMATDARGVHEAVIAVPSWFDEAQRAALLTAAARAQIQVKRFIRDTVASVLWAQHAQRLDGTVAVVDVGAGA